MTINKIHCFHKAFLIRSNLICIKRGWKFSCCCWGQFSPLSYLSGKWACKSLYGNLTAEWLNSWGRAGLCLSISVHLHQFFKIIFQIVSAYCSIVSNQSATQFLSVSHCHVVYLVLSQCQHDCVSGVSWLCLLSSGMTIPEEDTEAGQTGKYCLVAIGRLQVCILVYVCAIIITTEIKKTVNVSMHNKWIYIILISLFQLNCWNKWIFHVVLIYWDIYVSVSQCKGAEVSSSGVFFVYIYVHPLEMKRGNTELN